MLGEEKQAIAAMSIASAHRVAIITSYNPPTHYSRFLSEALVTSAPEWNPLLIVEKGAEQASPRVALCECWQPGPLAYFQILRAVFRYRPALVHVQHELTMYGGPVSALLFPMLLLMLRLAGFPVVTTVHAVVAPWEVDDEFLRTFGMGTSRVRKIAMRWLFGFIYRSIGLFSAAVVVHSPSLRKMLVNGYRLAASRIATIPIGIAAQQNTISWTPEQATWWSPSLSGDPFFLFFGYLVRRKGLAYLIDAFSQFATTHPHHRLVLAGGILEYQRSYAEELQAVAERSGVGGRIVFTGFVESAAIHWLYERCQAVVLPYAYSISASLPLSFAFEYGKPVLGTAIGGLIDDVQNGYNGILVAPRSGPELLTGLTRMADDALFRQRLREGAVATRRERTWTQCAKATARLYDAVVHRRPISTVGPHEQNSGPSEHEQQ